MVDFHLTAKLVPGNHTITLHVSDGHGNDETKKIKINVGEREEIIEDDDDNDTPGSVFGRKADNTLVWMLVGGLVLFLLLVLLIFFIVMKRK